MNVLKELSSKSRQRSKEAFGIDLQDWSLLEWCGSLAGEAGELCNLAKKIMRDKYQGQKLIDAKVELGKELADVVLYADLIASREGIDLGQAIVDKFNEVSDRKNCNIKL